MSNESNEGRIVIATSPLAGKVYPSGNPCPGTVDGKPCPVTGSIPGIKRHFLAQHANHGGDVAAYEAAFGHKPGPSRRTPSAAETLANQWLDSKASQKQMQRVARDNKLPGAGTRRDLATALGMAGIELPSRLPVIKGGKSESTTEAAPAASEAPAEQPAEQPEAPVVEPEQQEQSDEQPTGSLTDDLDALVKSIQD